MSSISNLISKVANKHNRFIPVHFKRLIFLSTFYAKGAEAKIFERVDYERLNSNMHIATTPAAIESALVLQKAVLKECSLSQLIQEVSSTPLDGEKVDYPKDITILAEKIVDGVPEWVKYKREDMINDLKSLLTVESPTHIRTA